MSMFRVKDSALTMSTERTTSQPMRLLAAESHVAQGLCRPSQIALRHVGFLRSLDEELRSRLIGIEKVRRNRRITLDQPIRTLRQIKYCLSETRRLKLSSVMEIHAGAGGLN